MVFSSLLKVKVDQVCLYLESHPNLSPPLCRACLIIVLTYLRPDSVGQMEWGTAL